MEYITKCATCQKHNILTSNRKIKPKTTPINEYALCKTPINRYARCTTCKKPKRQAVIGEIVKLARLNRRNSLALRFWYK